MIKLRIHDEADLYNPYDPSQTRISEGVYNYLKSFCTEQDYKKREHETLQIITDNPIDAERAKNAIQDAVKNDQDEFDRLFAINRKRAAGLYIIGILLSAAGVTLSLLLNQIVLQLISFLGTMAIRDADTLHLKINPDIKMLKSRLDPFREFELEVVSAARSAGN